MERDDVVKLAVLGGGAFAAYEFLYKPWAAQKELERITQEAMLANMQTGMGIEAAAQNAIAGACVAAAAAKLKMPPSQAGPMCQGVGVLATKAVELTAKGAIIAGKGIGKGVVVGGKAVGKAAKAVAYTAPKAVLKKTASA